MKDSEGFYNFDELEVGMQFVSPGRTIAEYDLMIFAGLTGDYNELHTSELFAKGTQFGQRIAHGMLILSIANGLYTRCKIVRTSVFLGIENWKATAPVKIGDTIKLNITINDKRITKDGRRGIVKMKYDVINQNEVIVGTGIFNRMLNRLS